MGAEASVVAVSSVAVVPGLQSTGSIVVVTGLVAL